MSNSAHEHELIDQAFKIQSLRDKLADYEVFFNSLKEFVENEISTFKMHDCVGHFTGYTNVKTILDKFQAKLKQVDDEK